VLLGTVCHRVEGLDLRWHQNDVNSREEKNVKESQSREKVQNFERNIPQVVKMEKEAPKINSDRFKMKGIESFL